MGNYNAFKFELDTKELEKFKPLLTGKELFKLVDAGMRYASKSTGPAVGKQISQRYSIGSRRVQADVRGPFITSNAPEIESKLFFSRRPPTGMQYRPRQTKSGVDFRFFKREKTSIRGAFLQTVKGNRLPFKPDRSKLQKPQPGRNKPRFALKTIYGPSVGSMYLGDSRHGIEIRQRVDERINEQFTKGVERRVKSILRGYGFK
jgi:hypothetical protein